MAPGSKQFKRSWSSLWSRIILGKDGHKLGPEARGILLVIVTLIAAVTFQAGINPPGGVWQDDSTVNTAAAPGPPKPEDDAPKGHKAGQAIYASQKAAFNVFLLSNTLALSTSILVMWSLAQDFMFQIEIFVATAAMLITYGAAVFAVSPHTAIRYRVVFGVGFLPVVVRILSLLIGACRKKNESKVASEPNYVEEANN